MLLQLRGVIAIDMVKRANQFCLVFAAVVVGVSWSSVLAEV